MVFGIQHIIENKWFFFGIKNEGIRKSNNSNKSLIMGNLSKANSFCYCVCSLKCV